ncbi:MAG: hypothetical protein L0206_12375 [Actinobacteria bacterium]|nr:hypothetical protein [Actinomycetota bacterium]
MIEEPAAHANDYLDAELAALGPPPSPGSSARYGRLERLLQERPPRSIDDVMEILRDHDTSPQSICLHADPAEGDEADAILFSMVAEMVAELEKGRMWVAPCTPCQTEYVEIDITGVR